MISFRAICFIFLAAATLCGCDYIVENAPFSEYENHEIRFEYPVYWELDNRQIDEGYHLISATSPLGSGIFLVINPIDAAMSLEDYSRFFSRSVNESLKEKLELSEPAFTTIEDQLGNHTLAGVRESYVANSAGVDVPQRRDYFVLYREKDVVYVIVQIGNDMKISASELERVKGSFKIQGHPEMRMLPGIIPEQ